MVAKGIIPPTKSCTRCRMKVKGLLGTICVKCRRSMHTRCTRSCLNLQCDSETSVYSCKLNNLIQSHTDLFPLDKNKAKATIKSSPKLLKNKNLEETFSLKLTLSDSFVLEEINNQEVVLNFLNAMTNILDGQPICDYESLCDQFGISSRSLKHNLLMNDDLQPIEIDKEMRYVLESLPELNTILEVVISSVVEYVLYVLRNDKEVLRKEETSRTFRFINVVCKFLLMYENFFGSTLSKLPTTEFAIEAIQLIGTEIKQPVCLDKQGLIYHIMPIIVGKLAQLPHCEKIILQTLVEKFKFFQRCIDSRSTTQEDPRDPPNYESLLCHLLTLKEVLQNNLHNSMLNLTYPLNIVVQEPLDDIKFIFQCISTCVPDYVSLLINSCLNLID